MRISDWSSDVCSSDLASAPLPAGTQNLGFVFIPDSTKPGSGGILTMTANGQSIGQGRIGRVSVLTAGPGETFDIGDDNGRPVMDYAGTPHFDGEIKSVRITLEIGRASGRERGGPTV